MPSSENVFDLETRRAARVAERESEMAQHPAGSAHDILLCPFCGGEWFSLREWVETKTRPALAFAADGHVRAISGIPCCLECGKNLNAGPWAGHL